MSASIRGRSIDKRTIQELGGLELSDLEKANSPEKRLDLGARLERPILRIPLKKVAGDSPMQTRLTTFEPEIYEEDGDLLRSVKKFGVLEPIMVSRESDTRGEQVYNVVFGHRRKAAAELAGHKMIPAIVATSIDNIHLLTLAENTGARSLTPYERAVGLFRWKENDPAITQIKLAEDTGISQGTVSTLIAAYEASTPALRGLFASGMAPRAVVDLQETFMRLSEDEQVKLAEQLEGATKREVQYIMELLNEGIDQKTAIETIGTSRKNGKNKIQTVEVLEDEGQLRAISELTGASLRRVKTLATKAVSEGASVEALQMASLYVARGGGMRNPIPLAHKLSANSKINRLVTQFLKFERKAKKTIAKNQDAREARFLRTLLLGETE
jgi:ParB/RepB/Spo0J family partition protein